MVSIDIHSHWTLQRIGAFMFAAAPAITSAPQYRQSAPVATGDVVIVVVGCVGILAFGIGLMVAWNRFNPPPDRTRPRGS